MFHVFRKLYTLVQKHESIIKIYMYTHTHSIYMYISLNPLFPPPFHFYHHVKVHCYRQDGWVPAMATLRVPPAEGFLLVDPSCDEGHKSQTMLAGLRNKGCLSITSPTVCQRQPNFKSLLPLFWKQSFPWQGDHCSMRSAVYTSY